MTLSSTEIPIDYTNVLQVLESLRHNLATHFSSFNVEKKRV